VKDDGEWRCGIKEPCPDSAGRSVRTPVLRQRLEVIDTGNGCPDLDLLPGLVAVDLLRQRDFSAGDQRHEQLECLRRSEITRRLGDDLDGLDRGVD